jgi:hypothetical protein
MAMAWPKVGLSVFEFMAAGGEPNRPGVPESSPSFPTGPPGYAELIYSMNLPSLIVMRSLKTPGRGHGGFVPDLAGPRK